MPSANSYPFHPRHLRLDFCVFSCLFVALMHCLPAEEIKTLRLTPAANMSRAEILPLLLYGFSGGAHFTSRFEEWNPAHVLSEFTADCTDMADILLSKWLPLSSIRSIRSIRAICG